MRAVAKVMLLSSAPSLRESVRAVISTIDSCDLEIASDITAALQLIQGNRIAVAVIHIPQGESGLESIAEVLWEAALLKNSLPIVVVSDDYNPAEGLTFLRLGVADYMTRPLDLQRLALLVDELSLRARQLPDPNWEETTVTEEIGETDPFLCGTDALRRIMKQIRQAATQDSTIMLNGETGTGKTRLARLIHELSPRRHRPFLVVNCGSLSETLIESEIFGHVKGAFTGADRDRVGKFAEVGPGTLLLDDIDALSLRLQAKLLRVVEDREFEPVGSNKTQQFKARLIVASNRDLQKRIERNRFRSDLYYRLNVIAFHLPALRDHRGDIPALVQKFIRQLCAAHKGSPKDISSEAVHVLQKFDWPGNVRELRNVIERAVVLSGGPLIQIADFPETVLLAQGSGNSLTQLSIPVITSEKRLPPSPTQSDKETKEYTRVTDALQQSANNCSLAAQILGISRQALYKKLHRLGLK